MTLTFVISHLGEGGAERVLSILASHWAEAGHRVRVIVIWGDGSVPPAFPLHQAISVRYLHFEELRRRRLLQLPGLKRFRRLREAIRSTSPDVVVSLLDTVSVRTVVATRGLGLPVVCVEHCDPNERPLQRPWETLRRLTYPLASSVVTLSADAMAFFPPWVRARGAVIPNPVLPPPSARVSKPAGAPPTLVSLGRLNEIKRIDVLLRVFARLSERHADWQLQIWGDGPERERLSALIDSSGLAGRAHLRGMTTDAHAALAAGDLFVMTSRTEGFPMALAEAMSVGVPAVSFDCPSGPRQLIRTGHNGLLVQNDDETALAEGIERLMLDPSERQRLGANARHVANEFSVHRIAAKWEALFDRISGSSQSFTLHKENAA